MKALLRGIMAFLRLIYQSVYLALGQIWANKMRSFLTTIGIVIGVASVTAVIAALTGLKAKVLTQVETFGTNTIFIAPRRPKTGPMRHASWWTMRFLPEQFDSALEHCPSVAKLCRIGSVGRHTARFGEESVENVSVTGIEPSYHDIENRPVVLGRRFSVIDDMQRRQVCLIDPKLQTELRLDRDCVGQKILLGHQTFVIAGVVERRPELNFGQGGEDYYEVFVPFRTVFKLAEPGVWAFAAGKSTETLDEAQAELRFFLRRTRGIRPGEPDNSAMPSPNSSNITTKPARCARAFATGWPTRWESPSWQQSLLPPSSSSWWVVSKRSFTTSKCTCRSPR